MIEVVDGCIRDVSYILANIRAVDKAEIVCQLPKDVSLSNLAPSCVEAGAKVAKLKGQPVGLFFISPLTVSTAFVSMFGTEKINRAVPAMTRHIFTQLIPEWRSKGFRRFEARTLTTHSQAHRWLKSCGAVNEGILKEMGRDGEDFFMYALTSQILDNMQLKRWQSCV